MTMRKDYFYAEKNNVSKRQNHQSRIKIICVNDFKWIWLAVLIWPRKKLLSANKKPSRKLVFPAAKSILRAKSLTQIIFIRLCNPGVRFGFCWSVSLILPHTPKTLFTPSQTADKTTKSQEKKHKIPKILKIWNFTKSRLMCFWVSMKVFEWSSEVRRVVWSTLLTSKTPSGKNISRSNMSHLKYWKKQRFLWKLRYPGFPRIWPLSLPRGHSEVRGIRWDQ